MARVFTLSLLLFTQFLFSQSKSVHLSGKILFSSGNQPVEYASVMAINKSDSAQKFLTTTDTEGNFVFENLTSGIWILKSSFIGYDIKDTALTIAPEQKKANAGTIKLTSSATNLKEVTVTAEQQKTVEFSIDKKIYNVGQDINAGSGSASDVLRNIPSVQVDIDGNVSLRGSGNILFLVNGKPAPQFGKNAAEALQNFPASSIERIEVITNPSAKYKPDGTGGIINIVLKENTRQGMNGSLTLNAGNSDRYNGNISLGYKPGKLNMYGTFGLRQNTHMRNASDYRDYLDSTETAMSFYSEDNAAKGKSISQSAVFGIDYELDSSNTISFSGNYFHFDVDRDNTSGRKLSDKNNILLQDYERFSNLQIDETEMEGTLAWEHKFKKEEHALALELVGVIQDEHEYSYNSMKYFYPSPSSSADNIFLDKKDNPAEIVLDYTNPISEDAVIEAGYLGTFNYIDVNNHLESYDSLTNEYIKDNSTSYIFKYTDIVNAVYATWEQSIEDFGFILGLRGEHASLNGNVPTIDSSFSNEYFSLYPTAHLKYEMDNMELGLSYSRRVNRPDGDELNPFPEYDDPSNMHAGNPKLLPEYIHSAELGAEIKTKSVSFLPTFYYRYTYNGFTTVTKQINDSVLLTTEENLSNDQEAGLELIFSGRVAKWLSGNLSGNIFYKQIDASNLGYSKNKSTFSFSNNLNLNITATKSTMFQLSCNYRSEELTPQGKYLPNFSMNLGAKQEFFRNKLALVVTLNDVFKSQKYESVMSSSELKQTTMRSRDSRILFIGLKYRFGSVTKKSKEEAVQFDGSEK